MQFSKQCYNINSNFEVGANYYNCCIALPLNFKILLVSCGLLRNIFLQIYFTGFV